MIYGKNELEMYQQEIDDREVPRSSRVKLAKVTLYLEVPSSYEDEYRLCSDLDAFINEQLKGVTTTAPSEGMISKPGHDNPINFKEPVGYLAPDGKFYLRESSESGLVHLELAEMVYKAYEDTIDHRFIGSTYGLDYDLEKAGFIKVHCNDIRYLAHWPVRERGGWLDTPDPTPAQMDALIEYCNRHSFNGYDGAEVGVNEKTVKVSQLKQAEPLMLRKIFSL